MLSAVSSKKEDAGISEDSDDIPVIDRNPRDAQEGDTVEIYWPTPNEGWWQARVQSIGADGRASVKYEDDKNIYRHVLKKETHHRNVKSGSSRTSRSINHPWRFVAATKASTIRVTPAFGCELFPLHRLLVVAECFWHDFRLIRKHVEFRPESSLTTIRPGMFLLLCPPLDVRRKKPIDLLLAEVERVVILSLSKARKRFPIESKACDLANLSATWKCRNIGCIIVKDVRSTKDFACLAPGNEGFLHQFSQAKGTPQFCARKDVGKIVTLNMVRRGTAQAVQRRLINPDSSLTNAGDCLLNACSECMGELESSNQVPHPQKWAPLSYVHIYLLSNSVVYSTSGILFMILTFISLS